MVWSFIRSIDLSGKSERYLGQDMTKVTKKESVVVVNITKLAMTTFYLYSKTYCYYRGSSWKVKGSSGHLKSSWGKCLIWLLQTLHTLHNSYINSRALVLDIFHEELSGTPQYNPLHPQHFRSLQKWTHCHPGIYGSIGVSFLGSSWKTLLKT